MLVILIVTLAFALLLAVSAIATYNRLVHARNATENAFGAVDAQLKNRFDLVPNVVAAVEGYATHERSLLEKLTALRAEALAKGVSGERRIELDRQVAQGFRQLVMAMEAYPDLKASRNFEHLQQTLVEVESQVAAARRAYNSAVTELNDEVQAFPGSLVASATGFRRKEVLETPVIERARVDVGALLAR